MKRLLIALTAVALVMTACQKEASFEDPNAVPGSGGSTGGGNNGTKLVRLVTKTGADSVTSDFTYSSANLISNLHQYGTVDTGGAPFYIDAQIKVVRNASNVVTKTVTTANFFLLIGLDSLVTNYVFDATNSRYKYGLTKYTFLGVATTDSLVFTYDATGKIVSGTSYQNDGTGYVPDSRTDYTYSGNNIASEKSYSYNGSGFNLDQTTTYDQYDTKVNPLQFPADAPVLGMTTYYSANNVTKKTVTDASTGTSESVTATFTYNTNNRPTNAVGTSNGSVTEQDNYYYQ